MLCLRKLLCWRRCTDRKVVARLAAYALGEGLCNLLDDIVACMCHDLPSSPSITYI